MTHINVEEALSDYLLANHRAISATKPRLIPRVRVTIDYDGWPEAHIEHYIEWPEKGQWLSSEVNYHDILEYLLNYRNEND